MATMSLGRVVRRLGAAFLRRRGALKSFEQALQVGGGMAGRSDAGHRTVEVQQIVGSVGRAMTARHHRVGQAMREGKALPPLELYKVVRPAHDAARQRSEYYVLDGHHRVAMARRIGQEFVDAHVVEYRLNLP